MSKRYSEKFPNEKSDAEGTILKNAFDKAHDIRKFEIDLYWKRTTYFWTLIAAIFAGHLLLASKSDPGFKNQELYLTIISCLGFIFSFAWLLVIKGSKFWQENWEAHLDLLEEGITGPLYKTVLETYGEDNSSILKRITKSNCYSVSKINQLIALFTIAIWVILIVSSWHLFSYQTIIIAGTLFYARLMYKHGKSDLKNKKLWKVNIIDRETQEK